MSPVVELPPAAADRERWVPAVGTRVGIVGRDILEASLRAAPDAPRPLPSQLRHGGGSARVEGVRIDAARQPRYRLEGLPGEWLREWLRPLGA